MKKRFALIKRKLKSAREEKLSGRVEIFSVAAGLLIAAFFTGMIYTKQELYAQEETQKHLAQEVFRFHVLANSDSERTESEIAGKRCSIGLYERRIVRRTGRETVS